jgi:predicted Zn-dependent protease
MIGDRARRRFFHRPTRRRALRPNLEQLEDRALMYATTGMSWPEPSRITYSFMPDGTSIGGVPSNLQQTLNAHFATSDWQAQFSEAAAAWEEMANINFSVVTDDGSALGVSGNLQSDPEFGDIRIGGYAMTGSILAYTFLPPPANGGTAAGDIIFNTSISWEINATTYDLMTVALHEFGHALGMAHSTNSTAVMYPSYTGAKQVLTTDDISGIRSIYNARQPDFLDAQGPNGLPSEADDISSYIDSKGQVSIPGLDLLPPATIGSNDIDWYKITVPTATTGTMVVKLQSTNLSLLSPWLGVYNSTGTTILGRASSSAWGDTVTVTINNVSPGQVYDIKCTGSTTGSSGFGAYGLQVNFGSQSQAAIPPPNTTVAQQPNQGGGTLQESSNGSSAGDATQPENSAIRGIPTLRAYVDQGSAPVRVSTVPDYGDQINVGNFSGAGDPLMTNFADATSLDAHTFEGPPPWTPVLQLLPITVATQPAIASSLIGSVQMTPLDFVFGMEGGDTATATIDNGSPGQVEDTQQYSRAIPGVSTSGTGPNDLCYLKTVDCAAVNDQVVSVAPSLINAKDRYFESMPSEAVDDVLDGWMPDLFE